MYEAIIAEFIPVVKDGIEKVFDSEKQAEAINHMADAPIEKDGFYDQQVKIIQEADMDPEWKLNEMKKLEQERREAQKEAAEETRKNWKVAGEVVVGILSAGLSFAIPKMVEATGEFRPFAIHGKNNQASA